jgi:hypothetical protein
MSSIRLMHNWHIKSVLEWEAHTDKHTGLWTTTLLSFCRLVPIRLRANRCIHITRRTRIRRSRLGPLGDGLAGRDLLYKFSVQPPDLLCFWLTFGAKIPIFRCGGQKFGFWTLSQPFAPTTRIFQRLLSLAARFSVYIINVTSALWGCFAKKNLTLLEIYSIPVELCSFPVCFTL